MRVFLLIFCAFSFTFASIGTITNMKGLTKVLKPGEVKKVKVKKGYEIQPGDILLTYKRTKTEIELKDKSKLVLDAKSKVLFASANEIAQEGGRVFYEIRKRGKAQGIKVKTAFAIIGVKGTKFIVNDEDKQFVSLNKGLLGIENPEDKKFERRIKTTKEAFNLFKKQMEKDFAAYKQKFSDEIVEHVKSFDLVAGKQLVFNKNVVEETFSDKNMDDLFESFNKPFSFEAMEKDEFYKSKYDNHSDVDDFFKEDSDFEE